MTVSDGFLDMCTIQRGGASCGSSFDCGLGGVCVNSKCVCQDGWNCNLCSQKIKQDTLAGTERFPFASCAVHDNGYRAHGFVSPGARCDKFVTGGGMCVNNWDCNQGSCVSGRCVCNPSYGCTQCTQRVDALISGSLYWFWCPTSAFSRLLSICFRFCTMFLHERDVQWPR